MRRPGSRRARLVMLGTAGVFASLTVAAPATVHAQLSAGCPAASPGDPGNTTGSSPPGDWLPELGPASCEAALAATSQVSGSASASPILDSTGSNWVASVDFMIVDQSSNTVLASCNASETVPVATSPRPPGDTNCSVSALVLDSAGQPTTRPVDAICVVSGQGYRGEYFCTLG